MKEVASLDIKKSKAGSAGKSTNLINGIKAPAAAFILTAICYIALIALSGVYPFGDHSILMSDLEAQYAPFLFMYRNILTSASSLKDLTYSFMMGMGKNMMGTFGYYLASPFNLLVLLFKPSQVSEFITLLMVLKLSFSSSFMCIFLRKRSSSPSRWPILFGVVYAFSSFVMVYMFNIMWLDGYMLLPLVLYFTEKYIFTGKRLGLTISLLILFLSNYYIAYMVGIYVFLYLLVRMYSEERFKDGKAAAKQIFKFVLTAVLCGLTLCVIILPVGLDTIRNADPSHSIKTTADYVGFSAIDILDQIFLGEQGEFLSHNMPYLFMSISITFLCTLFFVSKVTPKKEKKLYGILFGAVYFVLAINALDKAWQVFDTPNWFFHRESFVFYPLFAVVALKTIERIKEISNKEISYAMIVLTSLLFLGQSFGELKQQDGMFLLNLGYMAALMLVFMGMKKTNWHEQLKNMPVLLPFITALLTVVEVSFLAPVLSSGLSIMSFNTSDASLYSASINGISELAAIDYPGKSGFRTELEQFSTENKDNSIDDVGSFYGGYNGVSFFNSNSNKKLHRFLKQFGYTINYNYFSEGYGYTAPDTDAFLSIGSVMTRSEYSGGTFIAGDSYDDGLMLYQNTDVLPLAFAVPAEAYSFDFYSLEGATGEKNYLSFRNLWFSSLFPDEFTGIDYFTAPTEELVPDIVNGSIIDMTRYTGNSEVDGKDDSNDDSNDDTSDLFDYDDIGSEIEDTYRTDITHVYRINDTLPIVLSYDIPIESSDELYLNISNARCLLDCSVYVNGKYLASWSNRSFYSSVIRLGSFEEGETVNVSLVSDNDEFEYVSISFAYFDKESFSHAFEQIDTGNVQVVSIKGGDVVITADLDEGDTVLTTIPYEDGWSLTVDGMSQEIKVYQDALIGIDCGSGHHDIHLTFTPPGMKTGAVVSAVGIIGLIALAVADGIKPKKKIPSVG